MPMLIDYTTDLLFLMQTQEFKHVRQHSCEDIPNKDSGRWRVCAKWVACQHSKIRYACLLALLKNKVAFLGSPSSYQRQ